MKADGYSLDQKRDFIDGKGDIPDIISKFKADRTESDNSILVPFSEIKKNDYNLSIARYKGIEHEEVEYEEPESIIKRAVQIENEISISLDELDRMIKG